MTANVVYVRSRVRSVLNAIRSIPSSASGHGEAQQLARQLMTRVGMAALARIRDAFVVKSRGGTDDCGLRWPPLQRSTIAYSRRHPGVLFPGRKRAPFAPSWMLTDKQRKRWWQLNAIGGPIFAWHTIKAEGGKTLIGEYGDTQVDILRDTGLLLNSFSPGVADNVFRVEPGAVIVGTNRKWAGVHHHGNARIPQRRLWPAPETWVDAWWSDIAGSAREGLVEIAIWLIQRRAA